MIKFKDFLIEGVYVAMGFDKDSQQIINNYQIANNIENPVEPSELHVTVIYSKQNMLPFNAAGILEMPIIVNIIKFDIYNGALVGVLDSPELEHRHSELLHKYKGSHSYDSYSPHVTFAYDFKGSIDELSSFNKELRIYKEYKTKLRE